MNKRAERLVIIAKERGLTITTAESCTGGMIAAAITDIAGSSVIFGYGFVTYANQAKIDLLNVDSRLLETYGAVSAPVAAAMAEGALERSRAMLAIAVTGVAGPEGGSAEKPVGTVWFGLAERERPAATERLVFPGDREAIRAATVNHALDMLMARVQPTVG